MSVTILKLEYFSVQNGLLKATLLYNYTAVHSLPVVTHLVTSARLRMTDLSARIHAYVWPWPEHGQHRYPKQFQMTLMMIGMAIIFVVPTFASEIVRDRTVCYVFTTRKRGVIILSRHT